MSSPAGADVRGVWITWERQHALGERIDVSGLDDESIDAVRDHLRHTADARHHRRAPMRKRLQDHVRQSFRERTEGEHVGRAVDHVLVGAMPEEEDALLQSQSLGLGFEL